MRLSEIRNHKNRLFGGACAAILSFAMTGCAADYEKLSSAEDASSCAAWLTGNAPLESPPRVTIVDEPITVSAQHTSGAAYTSLNLVKVRRGSPEQTASRIVHEMAHIYGATEGEADFAERNAWRCALG